MGDGNSTVETGTQNTTDDMPEWLKDEIPTSLEDDKPVPSWLVDPNDEKKFIVQFDSEIQSAVPPTIIQAKEIAHKMFNVFNTKGTKLRELKDGITSIVTQYESDNTITDNQYAVQDQQIWGDAVSQIQKYINDRIDNKFNLTADRDHKKKYVRTLFKLISQSHPGLLSSAKNTDNPLSTLVERTGQSGPNSE